MSPGPSAPQKTVIDDRFLERITLNAPATAHTHTHIHTNTHTVFGFVAVG